LCFRVWVRVTVRDEARVSGYKFKYIFGQTSIGASVLDLWKKAVNLLVVSLGIGQDT